MERGREGWRQYVCVCVYVWEWGWGSKGMLHSGKTYSDTHLNLSNNLRLIRTIIIINIVENI